MTPVLIPCSRNARPMKGLVRLPQWNQHGCHSRESETSKLGRIIRLGGARPMRAHEDQPGYPVRREASERGVRRWLPSIG